MPNRALAIVIMLLFCRPVLAMDLIDLYREAKANDARYAAAEAQFRVMQERVPLAKAGVAPQSDPNAGTQSVRGRVSADLPSYHLHQTH